MKYLYLPVKDMGSLESLYCLSNPEDLFLTMFELEIERITGIRKDKGFSVSSYLCDFQLDTPLGAVHLKVNDLLRLFYMEPLGKMHWVDKWQKLFEHLDITEEEIERPFE